MARKKNSDSGDSIEEMIAFWQDSRAQAPLLYVEGKEDVLIYREILLLSGIERERFSCIPVKDAAKDAFGEGRLAVYSLFEVYQANRHTISRPILFFADKDLYVFGQVPEAYAEIYFTHGYSIENDLFCDGEALLMAKLHPEERERFAALLDSVCAWFGHAKDQQPPRIGENLRSTDRIAAGSSALAADFMAERGFLATDDAEYTLLRANFKTHLRGKFLFELLWRVMMDRGADTLRITHEHSFWLDCIAEGLRHEGTNCRRIADTIARAAA